jgi:Ion channel
MARAFLLSPSIAPRVKRIGSWSLLGKELAVAVFVGLAGIVLLGVILWDAFETIILPRRVTRRYRLAGAFYKSLRTPWYWIARRIKSAKRREGFLGVFGPLSVLILFGVWAGGLILSFGMLQWAVGHLMGEPWSVQSFRTQLYLSGTSFFTLGLGDVTPHTAFARIVTVAEAGMGFAFLAVVISYLPVLYGAFSRREANIALLDARAGSPPTAAELLRRHVRQQNLEALDQYLRAWESWAAELMESHLSYPVLCYFRSQHNNQSWVSALATILDACALLIAHTKGALRWQAELTFAICRHALVDMAQALAIPPRLVSQDRFEPATLMEMRRIMGACGTPLCKERAADETLEKLRAMYEPYLFGFSERLLMAIPSWGPAGPRPDNWRTSAWERVSSAANPSTVLDLEEDDHS